MQKTEHGRSERKERGGKAREEKPIAICLSCQPIARGLKTLGSPEDDGLDPIAKTIKLSA